MSRSIHSRQNSFVHVLCASARPSISRKEPVYFALFLRCIYYLIGVHAQLNSRHRMRIVCFCLERTSMHGMGLTLGGSTCLNILVANVSTWFLMRKSACSHVHGSHAPVLACSWESCTCARMLMGVMHLPVPRSVFWLHVAPLLVACCASSGRMLRLFWSHVAPAFVAERMSICMHGCVYIAYTC
jgi:hypothetical protein